MRIFDKQEPSFCKYTRGNQSHLKAFTPEWRDHFLKARYQAEETFWYAMCCGQYHIAWSWPWFGQYCVREYEPDVLFTRLSDMDGHSRIGPALFCGIKSSAETLFGLNTCWDIVYLTLEEVTLLMCCSVCIEYLLGFRDQLYKCFLVIQITRCMARELGR